MKEHPFQTFLNQFVPIAARKFKQLNAALWILETTGSDDAAFLKADLDAEMRLLYNDSTIYEKLLAWDLDPEIIDPILKRQLNILIRAFKQNNVPKELIKEMAQKEADLAQVYASFRPRLGGIEVSENDIRELLKTETNILRRKQVWEASKAIGPVLAPQILALVTLRNTVAKNLGYSDYFQMQLDLQEVDSSWLLQTLNDFGKKSENAYKQILNEIEGALQSKFGTDQLGPWAWSEPFCQEDPLDNAELDKLVDGIDISEAALRFYQRLGSDVERILKKSDMYERPGKNQHAFCINMDREEDVRTLNNVRPSLKWMETVLHELGHAIYEVSFSPELPWLLREPPHMITTEAMALIAGRQAYKKENLQFLVGSSPENEATLDKTDRSLQRRQLVFSRWVLVMTAFESELYRDPSQDLNELWWSLVGKYQKITPANREGMCDWACKYHIGLAPVYYFSYLLGEMFASAIQKSLEITCQDSQLSTISAGKFLKEKLFFPGNLMAWDELIFHVTGESLNGNAWIREFC